MEAFGNFYGHKVTQGKSDMRWILFETDAEVVEQVMDENPF